MAYKALPRPQFSSLQQAIFPVYFSLQTALPVVLALTYPGEKSSLISSSTPAGLGGFLAEKNRISVLVPLVTVFASSLANLLVIGPATTRIMRERKHQGTFMRNLMGAITSKLITIETRDGKKSYDNPPHSKEMMKLNRSFARMHGASSLLNLAGLLATVWYGVTLAERLQ